ncbi:DUF2482 family protein [Staphylococcus sp. Mo2-6]|uniref:DUF2482 family protein n=1 Tax=Staphylococcus sp. Mo2-6 TaxID=3135641 RepID=UPI0033679C29
MLTKEIKDMSENEITELLSDKTKELYELVNQINKETEHTAVTLAHAGLAQDLEEGTQIIGQGTMVGSSQHLTALLSNDEDMEHIAYMLTMKSIVSEMQEEADE